MKRDCGLPGGLTNLGDRVRVINRDGTDLGFMIVAEAQRRASDQGAELFVIERTDQATVVRIVEVRKAKTGWKTMNKPALLLIDVQVNMFEPSNPVWSAEALVSNLSMLLERARAENSLTVFVRNCGPAGDPDEPGSPGWELHPSFRPIAGELLLDKNTCDTFASTALDEELKQRGITHLVIAGLQSEYCIRETTLGALSRGYRVTLGPDGHSTYDGKGYTAAEKVAEVNAEFAGRVETAWSVEREA